MPAPPLVGAVESAVGVASVGEAVVVVSLFEEVFLTDSRFPLLLGECFKAVKKANDKN